MEPSSKILACEEKATTLYTENNPACQNQIYVKGVKEEEDSIEIKNGKDYGKEQKSLEKR